MMKQFNDVETCAFDDTSLPAVLAHTEDPLGFSQHPICQTW